MQERLEETIHLPDGRNLGYAEVGDSAGAPLVYFHGNPGSRLDFTSERYDQALEAARVRFIGTDRPGFGLWIRSPVGATPIGGQMSARSPIRWAWIG